MRYYYRDKNNNYYSYKTPHEDLINISEEEFLKLNEDKNNIDSKKNETLKKINALKAQLNETDYKAVKYAEGLYSDEEYDPIRQERELLREEIRRLENEESIYNQ